MEFKGKIMLHGFQEVKCQWEVGEVGEWEGGRFLILFKEGEHRVSPRFYLFASDISQGNKRAV